MLNKNKKKFIQSEFLKQIFLTIIGLFVILLISIPLARKISKQYRINQEIKNLKKEVSEIESKNTELKNFLSYLNSDQFIEEQAKLKLNYKKEGERVIVLEGGEGLEMDSEENVFGIRSKRKEKNKKQENYKAWIKYFFYAK